MAKEWSVLGLDPDDAFRQAASKIIATKLGEMWSYAPGTIAGEDIEELHSMRVSSRRLRAAVDVCAPCFPRKAYRGFQKTTNEITDVLGAVRDCDVLLDLLTAERKKAAAEERAGIDDLIAVIAERRDQLRPGMIAYLARLEADGFRDRFAHFLGSEAPDRPEGGSEDG